jgi:hypothetical protein
MSPHHRAQGVQEIQNSRDLTHLDKLDVKAMRKALAKNLDLSLLPLRQGV